VVVCGGVTECHWSDPSHFGCYSRLFPIVQLGKGSASKEVHAKNLQVNSPVRNRDESWAKASDGDGILNSPDASSGLFLRSRPLPPPVAITGQNTG
jgi:hypothetical protein